MARLKPQPYREVKRRLEAAGFVEISQKGSHVKFVRTKDNVVDTAIVPKKSEVLVGTLRQHLESGTHRPRRAEQLALSLDHCTWQMNQI